MKQRKISFKLIYLIYVFVLAALVTAAVLYVRSLLFDYEASQPEHHVQSAITQLVADASDEDFWKKYNLPEVHAGPFERKRDIKAEYLALFEEDSLTFSQTGSSEDELFYTVAQNGFPLAKIKLKAAGPAVTKLAVLSIREWAVESVAPVFAAQNYTLTLPSSFAVEVNGVAMTAEHSADAGNDLRNYTLEGVYLEPSFKITDEEANYGSYVIKNSKVLVEYYDYDLTLPAALRVSCNGTTCQGETVDGGLVRYSIALLTEPSVAISDVFGNTVYYEGGDQQLPLTYTSITVGSNYTVQVNSMAVPAEATTEQTNPEFAHFADYVKNLPTTRTYNIAILQNDANIAVTDPLGNPVALEENRAEHDLTSHAAVLGAVPAEVAAQVDVLRLAQLWSMFLTNDLPFKELEPHLIAGSYQHNVAVKYATGVDIQYTSKHTLFDPAFTENSVTNFTWITKDCFCVDISFVKHMRLYYGARVDDPMNDRFYFVYCDDTDNGVNDPAWKLAGMKEIV